MTLHGIHKLYLILEDAGVPLTEDPVTARLVADELIQKYSTGYKVTERGLAYLQALQMVPLPVQKWDIEWPPKPDLS